MPYRAASAIAASARKASTPATVTSAITASANVTSAMTASAITASATAASAATASATVGSATTASATGTSATTVSALAADMARLSVGNTAVLTAKLAGATHSATADLDDAASSYNTAQNQEEEEAMTASAASEAASGLSMSWEEFVAFYLPQCTSDFYASQGWVPNKELHLDQMVMVEAFQQEVFHMVNCALLNPE
ncbi:hypothetical protein ABBQ38_014974 [Trebouxia sp. C0009 RCD-2024]